MDKPQELVDAENAYSAAILAWDRLAHRGRSPQERILDGEEYVRAHPEDLRQRRMLSELKVAVARAGEKMLTAGRHFDETYERAQGWQWDRGR